MPGQARASHADSKYKWIRRELLLGFLLIASPGFAADAGSTAGTKEAKAADSLFGNPTARLLRIEIPPAGMNSLRRDSRTYVNARLQEGGTVYTNVLVRLKGGAGSFRPLDDKPGLTIKVEGQSFHGLKKFHLNNSVQDNSYISEWVCGEIFRQAGVPTARALPVVVELNRRRLGLYVLLERVNEAFLARTFKATDGGVYSPPGNTDISPHLDCIGGREKHDPANLAAVVDAARSRDLKKLAEVVDLERFISFMAVEVMLCHWDGYTSNIKNYLLYHDLDTNRMVFIPHDLDQLLQDSNRPVLPRTKGMVARAVLSDPAMRTRYLVRFGEIYSRHFVVPTLTQRIDGLVQRLAPGLSTYDAGLARSFAGTAQRFKTRIINRENALQGQLRAIDPRLVQK